ncbi:hypothetical protein [Halapricum hydrolyticum]|uniref:Uncharacterized protein n=1 Tax=Halapricum hydrolyticum TaxID=2979991 RepID=A0AAE3IDZ6_9EURY|nr:hypothetical protein [Halapricum hydrolyticum]MCU4718903.1 hypothetical protein [Halapricum hydrolyticum]MCU4728004.1 hypothetical protein [Halapricum hydrolyticum]
MESRELSNTLDELIVEAAKCVGVDPGEPISIDEVRAQAEANGYSKTEINHLLIENDALSLNQIPVPQENSLWEDKASENADYIGCTAKDGHDTNGWSKPSGQSGPKSSDDTTQDYFGLHQPIATNADLVDKDRYLDDDGQPLTASEAIQSYIEQRHGESSTSDQYGWGRGRRHTANSRYKKGMALDRQCLDTYENPTTVLLSLRLSPESHGRLDLLTELNEALTPTLQSLRYRLQKSPNSPFSSDDWEYFLVIAGTDDRATPHAHIMVYCNDDVDRDLFKPVVEKFVEKCEYSPDNMRGNRVDRDTISIRGNGEDEIPLVDADEVNATDYEFQGQNSQGAVYALTQLPHLGEVDEMEQDELLHSSTVDAWGRRAFRKSRVDIEDEYSATTPM